MHTKNEKEKKEYSKYKRFSQRLSVPVEMTFKNYEETMRNLAFGFYKKTRTRGV